MNRKKFIKTSIIAGVTSVLAPNILNAENLKSKKST